MSIIESNTFPVLSTVRGEMFKLRPEMLPYLLWQRTEYACSTNQKAKRLLRPIRMYWVWRKTLQAVVERMYINETARKYFADMKQEFEILKPFLPNGPCTILDIGCGLGGIDIFFNRHFQGQAPIHLLDMDGKSTIYYGFEKTAAHYNSAELTLAFLHDNDVSRATFHNAANGFPHGSFDLIISLISWGFHYSVETYLDQVVKALSPQGRIILDVRSATDGEAALRQHFSNIQIIRTDHKSRRIVASR